MEFIHPLYIVNQLEETALYYIEKLGFKYQFPFEEPDDFSEIDFLMLKRGQISLMFKEIPTAKPRPNREVHKNVQGEAFIYVDDPDTIYEEFVTNGVIIVSKIENTDWGTRQFVFADNNGYTFICGQTN